MPLNMSLPKVSIIVPVYNVEDYIDRCLSSISSQSYNNIEILFVDDCGSDTSISKVLFFKASYPNRDITVITHKRNRGLSAARNTGLMAATGDYVYFLDSDDDITSNCIEFLAAPLLEHEYDVVVGDYNVIGEGCYLPLLLPEGPLNSNEEVLKAYAEGKWYVMAWNKLYRRQFLIENDLFFEEGLIHEDVPWTFKVACKAHNLYVIKAPLYNYYVRSSSIMTSMSIEKDANIYADVFKSIAAFAEKEDCKYGRYQYAIIEGKKSAILYSLLQKQESKLYKASYLKFRKLPFANPWWAYKKGVIGIAHFCRDMHYLLPVSLGMFYKRMFYNIAYKLRCKKIEGAIWR